MKTLTLNGRWQLCQVGRSDAKKITATVPGCVHTDLLVAGEIPDPFYRDNELQVYVGGRSRLALHSFFFAAGVDAEVQ